MFGQKYAFLLFLLFLRRVKRHPKILICLNEIFTSHVLQFFLFEEENCCAQNKIVGDAIESVCFLLLFTQLISEKSEKKTKIRSYNQFYFHCHRVGIEY